MQSFFRDPAVKREYMIVKSHSMFLGYKEYQAHFVTEESSGAIMLELQGYGVISPLQFIKHGFTVELATAEEHSMLIQHGYDTRGKKVY